MQNTIVKSHRAALHAMLGGNFLIGTGILLPAGLLTNIAKDFSITPDVAGYLAFVSGVVVAIGAPFFATWTSRMDRRLLLTACMLLYAAGHFASAIAPTFMLQLVIRAFIAVGAALFTPQAAATVGLIMPLEKRASTIAFIFIGWSAATAAGVPLGNYLSTYLDWRVIYAGMGALCLAGAAAMWLTLPAGLRVKPLGLDAWRQAFSSPVLWLIYLVTAFSMAAQFSMLTYMKPIILDGFHATAVHVSIAFAVIGIAGVLGNSLASRVVARWGTDTVIAFGLAALALGYLGFSLFFGSFWPVMAFAVPWGLGSFSSNSLQQSRLGAFVPTIASVTIALNTSFVYVGQATGAWLGGKLLHAGSMTGMPFVALILMLVSLGLSLLATRLTAPSQAPAPR